jgi:peptidoglycan hydrolase-like protein with peptidoglycan-binding domain
VGFFNLNSSQGSLNINNFDDYDYLVIIPLVQNKVSSFGMMENYYKFTWSASFADGAGQEALIAQLTAQVELLIAEVARLQAQLAAVLGGGSDCQITTDLYYGMPNNNQVRCLQQFLKSQGPDIYPEGVISGNFYSMTLQAVIRFQNKYASEILSPVGLQVGTGFVGARTRNKIKDIMFN